MKPLVKKILIGVGAFVGLVVAGGAIYVWKQTSSYDSRMEKIYVVPVPNVTVSQDPAVIERGKHLAASSAGCATSDCHGHDLGGGKTMEMGPLGKFSPPNISTGGLGAAYTDGEMMRLITTGIKKDGRSVRFMPVQDFNWLPDSDMVAIISYLRSMPAVDKPNGVTEMGTLGKILDNNGKIIFDVAGHLANKPREQAPPPEPTAKYGGYVARLCLGCHGDTLAGGPIPGAPPDLPVPSNLTPDATGLQAWTYDDFAKMLDTGTRKNGEQLNPFMPLEALTAMDETERKALWAYLQSLPAKPFGSR
jgi:cytochrome c553